MITESQIEDEKANFDPVIKMKQNIAGGLHSKDFYGYPDYFV